MSILFSKFKDHSVSYQSEKAYFNAILPRSKGMKELSKLTLDDSIDLLESKQRELTLLEVAKKMLALGYSMEQIEEVTGLSDADIKQFFD